MKDVLFLNGPVRNCKIKIGKKSIIHFKNDKSLGPYMAYDIQDEDIYPVTIMAESMLQFLKIFNPDLPLDFHLDNLIKLIHNAK